MQTQPVEDIDTVLGRFQAWSGSRNAVETKPGIRELSHEESLRSLRYRWKAADETSAKKRPGAKPGAEPAAISEPKLEQLKTAPVKAREAKRKPVKKVCGRKHAAKATPPVKTKIVPEFREALANAVRPPEVILATAQPIELTRQISISIRLAPAERALIKTRAAEASISASAYIRQCALEVEQLRAQVQQVLAAMERKTPASIPAPASSPGFFARWVQKIFPGRSAPLVLHA